MKILFVMNSPEYLRFHDSAAVCAGDALMNPRRAGDHPDGAGT